MLKFQQIDKLISIDYEYTIDRGIELMLVEQLCETEDAHTDVLSRTRYEIVGDYEGTDKKVQCGTL